MERRRTVLFLLLLCLITGILSFFATPSFRTTGDDAGYLLYARALFAGEGYVGPSPDGAVPEVQYPPLFPILLAPAMFFSSPVVAGRLLVALAAGLALLPLFFLIKNTQEERTAWMVVLVTAVSPLWLAYGARVLSEAPYMLFVNSALLAAVLFQKEGKRVCLTASLLLVIAAWYMRSLGMALAAAVVVSLFLSGHRKQSILSATVIGGLMLPWVLRPKLLGLSGSYLREHVFLSDIYHPESGGLALLGLLLRPVKSAAIYGLKLLPDAVLNPLFENVFRGDSLFGVKAGLGAVLSLLVLIGFFRVCRRKITIIEIYTLCHAGLLMIHPVQSSRYLHPILPFLFLYLLVGGTEVGRVLFRTKKEGGLFFREWAGLWIFVEILLSIFFLSRTWTLSSPPEWTAYYEACDWIEAHTNEDAVVICRKPRVVMWETGRLAETYPLRPETALLGERIRHHGEAVVLRDNFNIGIHSAVAYLDPALEMFEGDRSILFRAPSDPEVLVVSVHSR